MNIYRVQRRLFSCLWFGPNYLSQSACISFNKRFPCPTDGPRRLLATAGIRASLQEDDDESKGRQKKNKTPFVRPKNENIPFKEVWIATDAERAERTLEGPKKLSEIMESINTKKESVELVSWPQEGAEAGGPGKAIVKVVNIRERRAKEREIKKAAREQSVKNREKEVQLSWQMTPFDMSHRVKKVKMELEKGTKVVMAFAPGSNASRNDLRLLTRDEMVKKIDEILESLGDGLAEEWKPRTIKRPTAAIYLRPKST